MPDKGSNRYIPVFEGLLAPEHIQKLGLSVFLFMELLRRSKGTPRVEVTYRDLQEKLGKPIRTLENWMKNLRDENYITVEGKSPMIVTIKINTAEAIARIAGGARSCTIEPDGPSHRVPKKLAGRKHSSARRVSDKTKPPIRKGTARMAPIIPT